MNRAIGRRFKEAPNNPDQVPSSTGRAEIAVPARFAATMPDRHRNKGRLKVGSGECTGNLRARRMKT
ncbi:hypothetical protein [Bradyrhizobium sp. JYMT SZCCT0428]|uniref:hypothetical protein n=1 Tax=Bradyrhizobium sp. JYMT SZCCT0428 TaxID=2807673 RepID=UPI001BA6AF76|nr:hypothetical protein [Bradyrhizobium sp. JYMT SZCCT0428]